jgi:hypothetical protein
VTPSPIEIASARRQFVLLAPSDSSLSAFRNVAVDCRTHSDLLAGAQKLRGKTYLDLGALDESQLSKEGRHLHADDDRSWHLVTLDGRGQVAACLRYLAHPSDVAFSKLTISHSSLAKSEVWGRKLRAAVEGELRHAKERGAWYVEMGGWAIAEALRCTTEALRMIVTAYALGELSGGALGITNATSQSCSASILRRIGGRRLTASGLELPSYFETEYRSVEAEILRFDSSNPNPRYMKWMEECAGRLRDVPVVCRARHKGTFRAALVSNTFFPPECVEGTA